MIPTNPREIFLEWAPENPKEYALLCSLTRRERWKATLAAYRAFEGEGVCTLLDLHRTPDPIRLLFHNGHTGLRFPGATWGFLQEQAQLGSSDWPTTIARPHLNRMRWRDFLAKRIPGWGSKIASLYMLYTYAAPVIPIDVWVWRWARATLPRPKQDPLPTQAPTKLPRYQMMEQQILGWQQQNAPGVPLEEWHYDLWESLAKPKGRQS